MKENSDLVPLEQAAAELGSSVDELKLCIEHGIILDCGEADRILIHRADVETLKELRQLHRGSSTDLELC